MHRILQQLATYFMARTQKPKPHMTHFLYYLNHNLKCFSIGYYNRRINQQVSKYFVVVLGLLSILRNVNFTSTQIKMKATWTKQWWVDFPIFSEN